MNQNNVENPIKVGHSTFDDVAGSQTNISKILNTTTNTKPVNIKIRIRNKGEMTEGLISVPKLTTTGPKKVRLVSSDQTIISFDIFMETENEKKIRKKPNYTFFKLFKPSGCFNNQNDDDIYPYIPSSSNETYRAKSASNVNDLQDDKIYDKKFALRKSLPPITSSHFLGKCKPGGCLDPPFGEDKYIYKPKNKMLAIDQKNIENHEFDEKCIEDTKNTDEVTDKPVIVLHDSPSKSSIEETHSHSLITYPTVLFSSDILEGIQNKKSKPRNSTENKVRISINEFSDTYFIPPKIQKNKNDEKVSSEFSETPNRYDSYDETEVDSFTQKESLPCPKNELFNQATETKLYSTQYHINGISQKIIETKLSEDDDATVGVSELSSANINIQISKSKSSISDVSTAELKLIDDTVKNKIKVLKNPQTDTIAFQGTENHNAETKTDTNLFETNLDSAVVTTSSLIYKDTIIIQDSQISTNRSNSILDKLKLKSNNMVDNIFQTSQDRHKSCIENQSMGSSFIVNTDENKIKFADFIHSDEITLKNSNTNVIESSAEMGNLRPISFTESVKLKHSNGKLSQIKKFDPSKISVKEEMQVKIMTDMHQTDFRQNKQLQDVINTAVINNEKGSDTIDIVSVKKYTVKTEDKKYGDQDFTAMKLSAPADVQITDHKSIRTSSEATNAVINTISAKKIESDKISSSLPNDLKTGSSIISDNIDINYEKSKQALQEKISSPYKQFSSFTIPSVEPTSSLNLSTPPALPEKTSSYKTFPIKNDSVKYYSRNSSADNQILISPSSLDLSAAAPSDNLEVHGPTDIVRDLIPISNVPVEIQSLQKIEIEGRDDLPTNDHLTEKEGSDDRGISATKTELQINDSKVTLLSDYKTSVTPTDYLKVHRSGDFVNGLTPIHNAPLEIQTLQNIDIKNLHDLPTKDHFTEKESDEKETLEIKTELKINNSSVTILSDHKTSATPTDLKVHGPGNNELGFIPISNVPVKFQNLQNIGIEDRHDLPSKGHFTEKQFDEKETLETKTELQITNSSMTILSDYKTSAAPTGLKVHGPNDNELGFTPFSNVPVKFQNLQNIGIEDRHDLPTKDHFTEKEEPDHKEPLNTKSELQNNNNNEAILSDYKTSSHYAHDTSDTISSINKKVENQSKISKADFYSKAIDLHIPKVLPAHSKETLMNDDEIILTKAAEKNLIRNGNLSVEINLGFYSFVNNKNETLIRTFDTSKDLKIDTEDKNITIIKSIIRKNDSEIRIPVNSEMDLTLQIKKTFDKGFISKREIDNIKKESMKKVSINTKFNKDVLLEETLNSVYENLVPVENIIQNLKKEADFLTQQQVLFREILSTMKTTSQRIINKNKSCTCNKNSIL